MKEKEWPFRETDPEFQKMLRFNNVYGKDPYSDYISKIGLLYGWRNAPKNEVAIFYCLKKELPENLVIPNNFEGLPVDFLGYLAAD